MRGMGHTGDQVQSHRTDDPIQETGGGYPTDTGAAVGYGGADTTGAFLADIGGTTGHGGGVTDKIKEKLPGGHKDEQRTMNMTAGAYEGKHEKKGIMDKIKEKLPGRNN